MVSMRRWPVVIAAMMATWIGCKAPAVTELPSVDTIGADTRVLLTDFSSDSKLLALLTQGNEVQFWDVVRGTSVATVQITGEQKPIYLECGARRAFVTVTEDQAVVWNARGTQSLVIPDEGSGIVFARADANWKRLAVGHADGSIAMWDLGRRQRLTLLDPPASGAAEFLGGGDYGVIYQLSPSTLLLRGLDTEATEAIVEISGDPAVNIAVSADGSRIASANYQHAVEVRSLPSGELVSTLDDFDVDPETLALSPDGSVLAVNGATGVELWEVASGDLLEQYEGELWTEHGIEFAPDGMFLSWVEVDQTRVRFWSPVSGAVEWRAGVPELIFEARTVCTDLATTIRFRQALGHFQSGSAHMESGRFGEAKNALLIAHQILPTYPGLAELRAEAEHRYEIMLRQRALLAQVVDYEQNLEFAEARKVLDQFVEEFPDYPDRTLRDRAETLRVMLGDLKRALELRVADRLLDSVLTFEEAVKRVPEVQDKHPEFQGLREELVQRFTRDALAAFEGSQWTDVIANYKNLGRLQGLEQGDWFRIGFSHEKLGGSEQASSAYVKVTVEAADFADARWGLSRLARLAGDGEQAKQQLDRARAVAPNRRDLETEYAEVCTLINDIDSAVQAWKRIGEWQDNNPTPFEEIAKLEQQREEWQLAGQAFEEAFHRAVPRREDLLRSAASAYARAERKELALELYLETLAGATTADEPPTWLGEEPQIRLLNWIRELGFVLHSGTWTPREKYLTDFGWVQSGAQWLRPEEVELRNLASSLTKEEPTEYRTKTLQEYRDDARGRIVSKGMNRRELVQAWGFFQDMNRTATGSGQTYEQLLYEDGRKVYLVDGLVCAWVE